MPRNREIPAESLKEARNQSNSTFEEILYLTAKGFLIREIFTHFDFLPSNINTAIRELHQLAGQLRRSVGNPSETPDDIRSHVYNFSNEAESEGFSDEHISAVIAAAKKRANVEKILKPLRDTKE